MMRGASRWEEPRTPVVASVPAARTATVAAPTRRVRMMWTPGVEGQPPMRGCLPRGCKSRCESVAISARSPAPARRPAARAPLQIAEEADRRLPPLRLVRERDLLEGLGVRHRQIGAGHAGDRRVEPVERLL